MSKQPDIRFINNIRKKAGKAINQYELIQENDKVLVALSGGRDSSVLLDILTTRLIHLPVKYDIYAIHVVVEDMPVNSNRVFLENFCQNQKVRYF